MKPTSNDIKHLLLSLDQVSVWPEMVDIVRRGGSKRPGSIACWEYPLLACEAVAGPPQDALPAMATIASLLNSIHLLDDLLDEDPNGIHHRLGVGPTANIAAAFQAAAAQLIATADLPTPTLCAAQASVAAASIKTAWGQHLDTCALGDRDPETTYWQVTTAKTPPLFASAFFLGALCGGAEVEVAEQIANLGLPIGKIIQAGDDMTDALATPAKPDWRSGWNNLAILFAQTAEHDERRRFIELLPQVEASEALVEAQRILVRCGAISFACYHVIEGYQDACRMLRQLELPDTEPLGRLLESLIQPSRDLFTRHDIEMPEGLVTNDSWRRSTSK